LNINLQKWQLLIPWDLGDYNIQTSKFFFWVFFSVNFFTPKLMKIWVFCTSFPNQVEHTCLKVQLQIYKYEWARIIFVDGGLDSKLQHYGPCNFVEKNKKLHIQIVAVTLKVTSCKTMSKKRSEKPRFYGQNKLFFENHTLQPLGSFSHIVACRSSLENTWKISLILVFNKNSQRTHTESELDVLGVHGKLMEICSSLI
jgi:hypothetical protein